MSSTNLAWLKCVITFTKFKRVFKLLPLLYFGLKKKGKQSFEAPRISVNFFFFPFSFSSLNSKLLILIVFLTFHPISLIFSGSSYCKTFFSSYMLENFFLYGHVGVMERKIFLLTNFIFSVFFSFLFLCVFHPWCGFVFVHRKKYETCVND